MKKTRKILAIVFVVMAVFSTVSYCFGGITGTPQAPGEAIGTANKIIGFIRWIGYAIAVGMLVFIGIKYVMASANEKADLKNALIRYVIGAALIAGGVTIAGWIFDAVDTTPVSTTQGTRPRETSLSEY